MILIDTNILMYAAGADHPHRQVCAAFMRSVAERTIDASVNAETLQEILHRFRSIRRWDDGRRIYDATRAMVPTVLPVTESITDAARMLLDADADLIARDAIHAAFVVTGMAEAICSFDSDFDRIDGLRRLAPSALI